MGMHREFQARIELSDRGVLVVRDMISAVARLGRDEVWHELSKTYPELAKFAANKDADMIPFWGDYEVQGLRFSFRLDLKNRRSHALEAFVNFVLPFIASSAVIVSAAEERDAKLNVLKYEPSGMPCWFEVDLVESVAEDLKQQGKKPHGVGIDHYEISQYENGWKPDTEQDPLSYALARARQSA